MSFSLIIFFHDKLSEFCSSYGQLLQGILFANKMKFHIFIQWRWFLSRMNSQIEVVSVAAIIVFIFVVRPISKSCLF